MNDSDKSVGEKDFVNKCLESLVTGPTGDHHRDHFLTPPLDGLTRMPMPNGTWGKRRPLDPRLARVECFGGLDEVPPAPALDRAPILVPFRLDPTVRGQQVR